MSCIFGNGSYDNDEAYIKSVKKKMRLALCLSAIGFCTLAVVIASTRLMGIQIPDFQMGFLEGIGMGLAVAGLVLYLKHKRCIGNKEKLRQARIEESDERNRAISEKAMRYACAVIIIVMYVAGIILFLSGSDFGMLLYGIICLFMVSYFIIYRILQKKM